MFETMKTHTHATCSILHSARLKQWACAGGGPRDRKTLGLLLSLHVLARDSSLNASNESIFILFFFLSEKKKEIFEIKKKNKNPARNQPHICHTLTSAVRHSHLIFTPRLSSSAAAVCERERASERDHVEPGREESVWEVFMVKLVPGNEKPYVLNSSSCGLVHYPRRGVGQMSPSVLVQKVTPAEGNM